MKKELSKALAWGGGMVLLALGAKLAQKLGYIDHDTATRVAIGVIGLWMAWYGNRLPKTFVRDARSRRAQRFSAWSQVLSGLAYAGLWAFAPISVAVWGGGAVVLAGMVATLGYCLSLRARAEAG